MESFQREDGLLFIIASGEVHDLQAIARNAFVSLFLFYLMHALQITTAFRFLGGKKSLRGNHSTFVGWLTGSVCSN